MKFATVSKTSQKVFRVYRKFHDFKEMSGLFRITANVLYNFKIHIVRSSWQVWCSRAPLFLVTIRIGIGVSFACFFLSLRFILYFTSLTKKTPSYDLAFFKNPLVYLLGEQFPLLKSSSALPTDCLKHGIRILILVFPKAVI